MAKNRAELTEFAHATGAEVLPGQLESAGLLDDFADEVEKEEEPEYTGSKFYRVRILNAVVVEVAAPDHVVRAPDKANAWEAFRREFGVISVDETTNRREITPATEAEFVVAQAKRLCVDLREHRQTNVPKKDAHYGLLTWVPPGGIQGRYMVSDKGELSAIAEE